MRWWHEAAATDSPSTGPSVLRGGRPRSWSSLGASSRFDVLQELHGVARSAQGRLSTASRTGSSPWEYGREVLRRPPCRFVPTSIWTTLTSFEAGKRYDAQSIPTTGVACHATGRRRAPAWHGPTPSTRRCSQRPPARLQIGPNDGIADSGLGAGILNRAQLRATATLNLDWKPVRGERHVAAVPVVPQAGDAPAGPQPASGGMITRRTTGVTTSAWVITMAWRTHWGATRWS